MRELTRHSMTSAHGLFSNSVASVSFVKLHFKLVDYFPYFQNMVQYLCLLTSFWDFILAVLLFVFLSRKLKMYFTSSPLESLCSRVPLIHFTDAALKETQVNTALSSSSYGLVLFFFFFFFAELKSSTDPSCSVWPEDTRQCWQVCSCSCSNRNKLLLCHTNKSSALL